MPVEITKFSRAKDRDGRDVLIQAEIPCPVLFEATLDSGEKALIRREEQVLPEVRVKFQCDGPSCSGDGSGPTKLEWEDAPGKWMPKEFESVLVLELVDLRKFAFCGDGCLLDFIKKRRHKKLPTPVVSIKPEDCFLKEKV